MPAFMFKIGSQIDGVWSEHSHPPVFKIEARTGAAGKVTATAPGSDSLVFRKLSECLEPPVFVLYVLHTPRGEADPGRYQSPGLTRGELTGFLEEFDDFLCRDARFDLWVHSPSDQATIVWDRHNLIHAYGRTDCVVRALRSIGFHEGEPMIPSPHEHHYHQALDADASAVISHFAWVRSALHPADVQ